MAFHDDGEHPRGQAGNAGQFRDKSNSGPEAALVTTPGQAVDARRARLETAREALGIYESGTLSLNDPGTGEHWTTVDRLAESLRAMLAEDSEADSVPARELEDIVDDAVDGLVDDLTGPDNLQRIRGAIEDAAREAQGWRPASDPAIELVEWARTAQEFMRSDKSNDWGEEVAALDAILESGD